MAPISAASSIPVRDHGAYRWSVRIGAVLFVLGLPIALIGTNVRYLFGEQRLYSLAITRYDAAAVTGIPEDELLRATRELRAYITGPGDTLSIQVTDTSGRSGPLYTDREIQHMHDVKRLVQGIFRAQEVSLIIVLAYTTLRLLLERRAGLRAIATLIWLSTTGFLLAGLLFGAVAAINFDWLFTRFHLISFSNDLWLLDPTRDRLIQMFPFEFWVTATTLLIALTLAETALLAVLARLYLWRSARGHRTRTPVSAALAG